MSKDLLDRFPVQLEVPIAWGEMDAFQHVNNLVYLRWFESARIAYLDNCNYASVMEETGIGPILRDTKIRYRIPLTYPGKIIVATRVTRMEEDRFTMEHIVYSLDHDKVAAEGEAVIVCVNYRENCKAAIPEAYKKLIMEMEPIAPEVFD